MGVPLRDVTVKINVQEPTRLLNFGKVLILGSKEGGHEYKEYRTLDEVEKDFKDTTEYAMASAIFEQENAPEKIAIYCIDSNEEGTLADGLEAVYHKDFYFVVMTDKTTENVLLVAEKINSLGGGKMLFTRTTSTADLNTYGANEDKYENLGIFFNVATETEEYPECALVGALGSLPVGSITWKAKTLKGVTADEELVKATLDNIHENGAITYCVKAGDKVTSEGITHEGEYIDVVHGKDYLINNIQYMVQKQINKTAKIPYTNEGIASIEAVVNGVLQSAFTAGIIAEYSTNFPDISYTTDAKRQDRVYDLGEFRFRVAGAIHNVDIVGTLTY